MKLSIGQAWDEAKGVFRADGGAITTVALALTVIPGTLLETLAPTTTRTADTPWYIALIGLVAALLSLVAQLAISRIALGPSTTVGEALSLGFRRLPALFGALFLASLPFLLVGGGLLASQGLSVSATPQQLPSTFAIPLLLVMLAGLYFLIRLIFLTPLAADGNEHSIALLKSAWRVSRGHFLKILGVLLLVMVVALLLLGALGGALSAVIILALGEIAPGNLSALLVALVQQSLAALVSVLFVVVVCRLYTQAAGGGLNASVPHAGGD